MITTLRVCGSVRGLFAAISAALLFGLLAACGESDEGGGGGSSAEMDPQLKAFYDAAIESGATEVVAYWPSGNQLQPLVDLFEERFEGITVEMVNLAGPELVARVTNELESGNQVVSLIGGGEIGSGFAKPNIDEWYEPFVPPGSENIPDIAKLDGSDGRPVDVWFAPMGSVYGIAYNTNNVSPDEVPTSWEDVLDPKWAGRIIIQDPEEYTHAAYAMAYLHVNGLLTEDFLARLKAQRPEIVAQPQEVVERLATGAFDIAFGPSWGSVQPYIDRGAPVGFQGKFKEGSAVIPMGSGQVKGAPSPDAARLFVAWLFTPEAQQAVIATASVPLVPGAAAPPDNIPDVSVDRLFDQPTIPQVGEIGELWRNAG